MRLTKSDKEAFVRAVMDDVPQIDYDEIVRSKVHAWALSVMPDEVRTAYLKYPEYIETYCVSTPRWCTSVYAPVPAHVHDLATRAPELWEELIKLGEQKKEQTALHNSLEVKVTGLIETCSTLKRAKELLPEFVKYLPADRDTNGVLANLPVANTVTDLMLAGWPKDREGVEP